MTVPELGELVRLAEYSSDLEAQIDAATLRSAQIQVEIRNTGAYMPMPGFGVSLYVFAADHDEAQALLAAGQPSGSHANASPTWRRSQTYIYVRLAMRIALALYVLLVIYLLFTS